MSYERVLLPVSGKQSGERALKALSQARKLDPKEIILLHAVAPSVGSPMPNIMRDQQDIAVKAEALLAPLAAELDNAGIPYQTVRSRTSATVCPWRPSSRPPRKWTPKPSSCSRTVVTT